MPLLRRKKKKDEPSEPPLSLEQALFRALFPGSEGTAGEISFGDFQRVLETSGPGNILFGYGGSNELRFAVVRPGPEPSDGAGTDKRQVSHRRLAAFVSLSFEGSRSNRTKTLDPCLLVENRFDREMHEGVLWITAEYRIFAFPDKQEEIYVAVEGMTAVRFQKKLDEEEEFRRYVRELIESENFGLRDSAERRSRIDLTRPLDFPAGYTLLPRRAPVGKSTAEVRFESVEAAEYTGPTGAAPGEEFWFTYTCRFAAGSGRVYYSVPLRTKTEAHTKYFSVLLSALVKYAAGFTQREIGPIKAGGKTTAPPKDSDLENSVRIKAGIYMEEKAFPVLIHVTPSFIGAAAASLDKPEETADQKEQKGDKGDGRACSDALLGLLSLNQSLLMSGVEGIDRAGVFAERTELIRVAELLNLLGPEDSRKIVQNLFLARGRRGGGLARLFYYRTESSENGEGKTKPRIIPDPQFRKTDFLPLLPRNLREEWNPASGFSESRRDLYAVNREAVEEILEAVESDRLILSYRGRYLLRRAVRLRIDAGYKQRVGQVFRKDLVPKLLTALSKPAAERTVSAFPSDELARILVADPETIETFTPFISKNKRRDVEEQHRLLEKDFEKGKLSFRSIYLSLYTLLTELKNARVKEEEQK
ncbi:MAG: hypothetical protein ACOCYA_02645 [Spirochaetota bacterium]